MTTPLYTLRYFRDAQDARTYRHQYGTGGWIFDADDGSGAILFPPEFPPSRIFHHPATRGLSGDLIGSQ